MIAVAVVVALIVYGTLYPWSFQPNPFASPERLLRSFPPLTRRVIVDAVTNVIIYIPLGVTLFLQLRKSVGRIVGALITVIAAFGLSFSLEYAQFFQRSRVPNSLDLLTNTVGAALGVSVAGIGSKLTSSLRKSSVVAIGFWIVWIGSLIFPLMPSFGLYALRSKLAGFLTFDTVAFFGFSLQWLVGAVLLAKGRPNWIGATFAFIPAQLFFAGRQPTLGMTAGAFAGAAVALLPAKPRTTALAGIVLLLAWELAPFRIGSGQPFGWIPFADAMETSRAQAVSILLAKAFAYGGCIALLVRAGASFLASAAGITCLLLLAEVAQMWIVGRTASLTDPVVTLLAATALAPSRGRV